MRIALPRNLIRRRQLTIGGTLVLVALIAVLMNWLRPISGIEAATIADRRFRTIPGASDWAGRYQARPRFTDGGNGRHYWIVNIVDVSSDEPLAQVSLDPRGNLESLVLSSWPIQPQSTGGRPTR